MATYLIDKSALARMQQQAVADRLAPLIEDGEAATCAIVELEVLYSARNADDHEQLRRRRGLAYERVELSDATFDRAIEVQGLLARTGRHRIPIPDLIIAAAAEQAGLTVMHYDSDFDIIAEITGQNAEWVAPRGTAG